MDLAGIPLSAGSIASSIALSVASIDDPSTELGAIAGAVKGEFRLCYQTVAGADEWTLYAWDSASSAGASTPYRINGTSGQWQAVAGKYGNGARNFNSTISVGVDADATHKIGYLRVGLCTGGTATEVYMANTDANFAIANYAIRLRSSGLLNLNAPTGQMVTMRVNNTDVFQVGGTQITCINGAPLIVADLTDASSTTTGGFQARGGAAVAKSSYLGAIASGFKGNVIAGVSDPTAAVAGQVGEVLSSVVSGAAVASTVGVGNVTSLSITAGNWLLGAMCVFSGGATGLTSGSTVKLSIVSATATNGTPGSTMAQQTVPNLIASSLTALSVTRTPIQVTGTTTYYLTEELTYAGGSPTASAVFWAERIR